jgi:asparagine N-glycosylation enzyme membrane subunit Stt3
MDRRKTAYSAAFILILVVGFVFRAWPLQYYGFHEPDDFLYYSVMLQTLSNGFRIPHPLALSGFPIHTIFGERSGLIYMTLVPFLFLKDIYGGITLYSVDRLLPVIFGLLEMVATYVLAYGLTKKKKVGLFAMFFLAVMPAAILRTQAGESRGDTFVPVLSALLLVALLQYRKGKNTLWKRVGVVICAALLLGWILVTWTAGVYVVGVLLVFALSLAVLSITRDMAKTVAITVVAFILLWGASWAALPHILPNYYQYLLGNLRLFGSIQETQPPNLNLLFLWFNFFLVMAPIGVVAYIMKRGKRTQEDYFYLALFANLVIGLLLVSFQIRWVAIPAMSMAVFGAYGLDALVARVGRTRFRFPLAPAVVSCFISLVVIFSAGNILTQGAPGYVTPQFLNATAWLKNDTPASSTVMTGWMDSSLVEALANRTVYVDSVNWGQNTGNLSNVNRIYNFSNFIFEGAGNFTFLDRTRPDYLLVRENWITGYLPALEYESTLKNISINSTNLHLFLYSNDTTITGGGVTLTRVYKDNDTIIYNVTIGK